MTVHIALDVMGGDHGPVELVSGAMQAVDTLGVEVTLLGDQGLIEEQLQVGGVRKSGIHIVHTTQVVSMHETPFDAVRKKKDSSIVVAFELLKNKKVDAVVSAGNSGATMASAIKTLGRLKMVSRPGIASVFPTLKKPLVMMDVGANVDCRPQHLFEFGVMASAFSKVLCGTEKPRIGLLSIGEEGGKGNVLVKSAHELFQKSTLNFVGNVEGRDIFLGDVDVIVCDGFVGNVCLKVSEGLAETILTMLKTEMSKSLLARLGYGLAKSAFKNFKKRVDYAEYGGAPLLGLNGIGIVCHGRSNAHAIKNAIKVAAEMVLNKVNDHINELLESAEYHPVRDGAAAETTAPMSQPGMTL
jgi:glycerol-3-phosphate acyltransferase PlsX